MTRLLHRPIDVVLENIVGAMPTYREHLGDEMLAVAARVLLRSKRGGIGLFVEADDCNPRLVLGPQGKHFWWVHQAGRDLDGVLAIGTVNRTAHGRAEWLPGAPASSVNAPRPILTLPVTVDTGRRAWTREVAVRHLPRPDGGARAADSMDSRYWHIDPDLGGADQNRGHARVAREYPDRRVSGAEVMFFDWNPHRVRMGRVRHFDVLPHTTSDDHPGLRAPMWPVGAG